MERCTKFEAFDLHPFDLEKLIVFPNIEHVRDIEDLPSPSPIDLFNDYRCTWKIILLHHFDESLDVMVFFVTMWTDQEI